MSVYGDFAGPEDVESAVLAVLEEWMPTYQRRVEANRELDEGALPKIRSYSVVGDYERYPQEQLPALTVESPGIVGGSITKDGTGYYSAKYSVEVSVTVGGRNAVGVRTGAQRYGEAVRGAILQRRSLGLGAGQANWIDEGLVGENGDDRMRRVTCSNAFEIELRNIVTVREGPSEPEPESDEWPEVESAVVDIEKEN